MGDAKLILEIIIALIIIGSIFWAYTYGILLGNGTGAEVIMMVITRNEITSQLYQGTVLSLSNISYQDGSNYGGIELSCTFSISDAKHAQIANDIGSKLISLYPHSTFNLGVCNHGSLYAWTAQGCNWTYSVSGGRVNDTGC